MTDTPHKPASKTKRLNLAAWVLLPALAILSAVAFVVLGGLPGVNLPPAMMDTLAMVPALSVQACAAIIIAACFNMLFCWEPCRSTEAGWHDLALAGNRDAQWLLIRADLRWAYLITLMLAFFWPVR